MKMIKTINHIIIVLLLLAVLFPWTPALAHEPEADAEPPAAVPLETPEPPAPAPAAEPEPEKPIASPFNVPEGYSARTLDVKLSVTIVDTPSGTSGITDAFVVLSVARELSARGEAGLVIACVPMRDNAQVCGVSYMAVSEGRAVVPVGYRLTRGE